MKKLVSTATCAALVLAVAATASAQTKGTGVIKGKVTFDGKPKLTALKIGGDAFCVSVNPKNKPIPDQAKLVFKKQGNAVPYAFVYIKTGIKGKFPAPDAPVMIDQKNCMYTPHVFGMIAGQQLDIKSSDETSHNIHALPKRNAQFNVSQPKPGVMSRKGKQTFQKPEMAIKIKCDVHGWMAAWCHVMTHPFFSVTKDHHEAPKGREAERGTFEITEVPAGEYTLAAWHETFGTVTQTVTIGAGETKEINFTFGKKKAALEPATPSRTVLVSSSEKDGGAKACCASKGAKAATTEK